MALNIYARVRESGASVLAPLFRIFAVKMDEATVTRVFLESLTREII